MTKPSVVGMNRKPTYCLARLETSHFGFIGAFRNQADAEDHLQMAWARHRQQLPAAVKWDDIKHDVNYDDFVFRRTYRNGAPI